MKKMFVFNLVAAMSILTTTAFGAIKEGSFSASPLLGGYIYGNEQQLNSSPVFGVRGGYNITKAVGVEALYDFVAPSDSKYWSVKDISMHRFGGQGLYHFMPDNQLVPYLAAGISWVKFSGNGVNTQAHSSFDYGAGAKYFVTNAFAVRADLRHLLYGYNSSTFNNVEFMLGATFHFGGVTPVAKPVEVIEEPKLAPLKDSTAPVAIAAPVKTGVPLVALPLESPKAKLLTPATVVNAPESVAVVARPVSISLPKENTGLDKKNVETVREVCSAPADTVVLFSYEKTDVKTKYYEELNRVGAFLQKFPSAKVIIEGHTSAKGNKVANLKLSQLRAETIKSHIVYKYGVGGNRITAKGYGITKPVASNETTFGRKQNRRIVAIISCN